MYIIKFEFTLYPRLIDQDVKAKPFVNSSPMAEALAMRLPLFKARERHHEDLISLDFLILFEAINSSNPIKKIFGFFKILRLSFLCFLQLNFVMFVNKKIQ